MPDEAKAGYARPALKVYGDAAVVTQSSVTTNMNDKGTGSASMT
ncbi:MAG TPA: hypothetical protein VF092_20135 [Longimicrobium sp.]